MVSNYYNFQPGASGILRVMVENEGLEECYEPVTITNIPPPGSSQNSSRSTTLTEKQENGLFEQDLSRDASNLPANIYKTKKPNQAKVPRLYITEEERQRLLTQQEATNEFHKFVEGNLILKQGISDASNYKFSFYMSLNLFYPVWLTLIG